MAEMDWIEKEVARVTALVRTSPKVEHKPRALSARYDRKHERLAASDGKKGVGSRKTKHAAA